MTPGRTKNFAGESGHFTFVGFVEDRDDPERLGRVKVRCVAIDSTDEVEMPKEDLPWAQVGLPTNSFDSAMPRIPVGTCVAGYFLDGEDKQVPLVTHIIPGKLVGVMSANGQTDATITGYSDGRSRIKNNQPLPGEPADPFAPQYPYNHAEETESGHCIELDDTPGFERVHLFHRKGSFYEIHPDGSVVIKSVSNRYDMTKGDSVSYCSNSSVTVNKDMSVVVNGNAVIDVKGNVVQKVGGNLTVEVGGTYSIKASKFVVKAGRIALN